MKKLIAIISLVALALVIAPAVMYLSDSMDKSRIQMLMLAGTVLWFVSAPFWMGRGKS